MTRAGDTPSGPGVGTRQARARRVAPRLPAPVADRLRFRIRTTAHHRTDDQALRPIYAAIAALRASPQLHDVGQRVEFHSCRTGGEWLQHVEIGGTADLGGWPVLAAIVRRHPGWVLSWDRRT